MTADRHEQRYLAYIADSVRRIREYAPATRDEFLTSPLAQDAIVWRLQTIADAARNHLSDELKKRHPEIRWRAVYGFRNIAAHGYAGLNLELVWEIVNEHLAPLLDVVDKELTARR
ncbi:MAG TPA: HepT-like ribonuclease domain-containing protein [Candidatus Dormibacteraeota bacterium]